MGNGELSRKESGDIAKDKDEETQEKDTKQSGRKIASHICRIAGTVMIFAVVLACLPVAVARIRGWQVYHVVSGSMEPQIPIGSLVFAEPVPPRDIQAGDVIAFWSGGSVIVHRVTENLAETSEFSTKGDANTAEDIRKTSYAELIGRIAYHIPFAGALVTLYTDAKGRIYALCLAACGALLNLLAGRLRR
ncbi:MAG: signal peptidase I [Roseburia sp.]|nr:signal peptidase I [Roseburia sp.]MCM1097923.1 signal peptidase I [Ruminococcus flavefaciens]